MSEENYGTAWQLLLRRFDNKTVLINDLLERLLNVRWAVGDRADEIRGVLDESKEIIYSLRNLGETILNSMIVHLVCSKLPVDTLSLWEQSCGHSTSIPEFDALDDFLENRIRTLSALESKTRTVHNVKVHVSAVTEPRSESSTCAY